MIYDFNMSMSFLCTFLISSLILNTHTWACVCDSSRLEKFGVSVFYVFVTP